MLAAILSFTDEGEKQSRRIGDALRKSGSEVVREHFGTSINRQGRPGKPGARDFVSNIFPRADLLIFVGACGIAVRLIAPHVRDKKSDPAVLVADELGHFVIPLLSGHLGGANRYAQWLADELGAVAVITTATDIEGRFAPDLFAEKYHLKIRSMEDAKAVAAAGLGQDVQIIFDVPCEGRAPQEPGAYHIFHCEQGENSEKPKMLPCVLVTNAEAEEIFGCPQCVLTPQNLVVGIGCKRGTGAEQIISFVREILKEKNLSAEALRCFTSIDLKRGESGIIAAASAFGVPFITWHAEDLNALPGKFTASEFVLRQTGTDNVCERSAVMAGGNSGEFLLRKRAKDGMTLAVYEIAVKLEA